MKTEFKISKKSEWAITPVQNQGQKYAFSVSNAYTTVVNKFNTAPVSTGLAIESHEDSAILLQGYPPSNWNKNLGIEGVIQGTGDEISVNITNFNDDDVEIAPFTKLTNMYFIKASGGDPAIVDSLDETVRGNKGFGSTGVK